MGGVGLSVHCVTCRGGGRNVGSSYVLCRIRNLTLLCKCGREGLSCIVSTDRMDHLTCILSRDRIDHMMFVQIEINVCHVQFLRQDGTSVLYSIHTQDGSSVVCCVYRQDGVYIISCLYRYNEISVTYIVQRQVGHLSYIVFRDRWVICLALCLEI